MAYEAQINFAAGELSPLLYYRSDIEARSAGVKEMLNMIALPHGPASARFGSMYMNQIDDEYARLFSFDFVDTSIPIVVGTNFIYIFDIDGSILETITSVYTIQDIKELQSAMQPRNETDGTFNLHLVTRGTDPRHIHFDGVDFTLVVSVFTGSDWTDHPGCIAFHDGRLYLAGTNNEPVTVWASIPNDFFDFDRSAGELADNGLIFPLAKAGVIRWIESNDVLFIGLSTGEQIIFSTGGPIAPDNANTDQQSKFGSKRVQALVAENLIVYVNTNGRVARGMTFTDTNEKYSSDELSFQAEHITEGEISELHYAESMTGINSMSMLFCLLETGDLVMMSLNTSQGTLGWHKHNFNDPIMSTVTINEDGIDYPWFLIKRGTAIYIEKYGSEYLDSYISVEVDDIAGNVVDGLNHLIGRTVSILADGKVHPNKVVDGAGRIVLDYVADNAIVGLGFIARTKTLPQLSNNDSGNTLSHKKRFPKTFVAIIDSARPKINGQDTFLRYAATSMGTREEFKTEILEVPDLGWDPSAEIVIEQELPLPLTIAAIGGKLKENKL